MRKIPGFTLIEVVVTLVVISIAATALMSVFSSLVRGSADPMIQQQAITIAEAYMEEIMLKDFADPQGGELGTAEAGETRASYDDVQDYNSVDNIVRYQIAPNNPIPTLTDYNITVNVAAATINATVPAMRIDISVSHTAIPNIDLSAFRTSY